MKRSTIAILILTIALLGSNTYWFVQTLGVGIESTKLKASYQAQSIALKVALAILPVAADPASSIDAIVNAGAAVQSKHPPALKDGFVHLHGIRLKSNEQGRLIEAKDNYTSGYEFLPRPSN